MTTITPYTLQQKAELILMYQMFITCTSATGVAPAYWELLQSLIREKIAPSDFEALQNELADDLNNFHGWLFPAESVKLFYSIDDKEADQSDDEEQCRHCGSTICPHMHDCMKEDRVYDSRDRAPLYTYSLKHDEHVSAPMSAASAATALTLNPLAKVIAHQETMDWENNGFYDASGDFKSAANEFMASWLKLSEQWQRYDQDFNMQLEMSHYPFPGCFNQTGVAVKKWIEWLTETLTTIEIQTLNGEI